MTENTTPKNIAAPDGVPSPKAETPQAQIPFHEFEKEIDLNELYPDSETDLNALFTNPEMRQLLKSVSKNKKDLHRLKVRFTEENKLKEEDWDESFEEVSEDATQETAD